MSENKDQYYIQDARSYVGNDVLWWADGGGYTTRIDKAEVFTKERAFSINQSRSSDRPWPKAYVDTKIRRVVDIQNLDLNYAGLGQ